MAGPIDKTIQVLASTANAHALDVLIAALDVDRLGVQRSAVEALIQRGSSRGRLEVIRRLPRLSAEARESLEGQLGRMSAALRQALLHGDRELRGHALELVRAAESFDQLPVLLEMLKDERTHVTDPAAEAMRDLTDRLYEHCERGGTSRRSGRRLRSAAQVKHNVLSGFDRALSHFDELSRRQDVIEAVLILGEADHFAVKKSLTQNGAECRHLAGTVLGSSRHPGVMQLILDYMGKNYPPPKVFEVLSTRRDPEFIAHLLRNFPDRPTPQQAKNYRQIESLAWIDPEALALEIVPPALQPALVGFTSASGLPADVKMSIHEWVVRHGTPEGRLAASSVLGSMDESAVQTIVASGLESEDEEIQAWATHQLRSRGVPHALAMLVERLDSPLPAVREAARDELRGFDLSRMLDVLDNVDPVVARRAGALIRKVDPDCLDKLNGELASPVRRRRVRAARAARLLEMHEQVKPALLALLEDDDPLVRRAGITALEPIRTADVIGALAGLTDDHSPRVREEASRVLAELQTAGSK